MKCPKCKGKLKVADSVHNPKENETYRRKVCLDCGLMFYTVEFPIEQNKRFEEEWAAYYRRNNKQ